MKIDFDRVEKIDDFVTVPNGTYLCRIAEIQQSQTRNGDERWSMRLIVAEGEFIGRLAAFDNLVFSPRGMARVKYVLGVLGLPNSGTVDVRPEQLIGREVFADVRDGRYENPETHTVVRRNEIPYRGYRAVQDPDAAVREDSDEDDDLDVDLDIAPDENAPEDRDKPRRGPSQEQTDSIPF